MDAGRRSAVLAVVAGALGAVVALAASGLFVVYSGVFDVAATEEHLSITRWAFDTTFHNSVERGAAGVTAPEHISPAQIAAGASVYKSACQHCHAGPGAQRADWAGGMRPRPPHLTKAAAKWELAHIYWIVKHGVKMTGMPAFGPGHDDPTLWGIAAFVSQLPAMTPERYAQTGSASEQGGHGH